MTHRPLVSVIVPVFNALPYLTEAIDSLARQTYSDLEFVAVDDGSTDGSSDALAAWSNRDSRVRVVTQEHGGFVSALIRATGLARGLYLVRLDADDAALPDRIERQVSFLERRPDVALVGGGAIFIDARGHEFARVSYPTTNEELTSRLEFSTPFVHSAVTMRATAFRDVGGYRLLPRAEDYDLWLRLSERFPVANLEDAVVRYRIHGSQTTRRTLDEEAFWTLAVRLAHERRRRGEDDPLERAAGTTREHLERELEIDRQDLERQRIRVRAWYAKTLWRAGARDNAAQLWAETVSLARAFDGDPSLAAQIDSERAAVQNERRLRHRLRRAVADIRRR